MDKRQLVRKMHQMKGVRLDVGEGNQTYISKDSAVKLVQDLGELAPRPDKVRIPQYVAEYIKECKENDNTSLYIAIRRGCSGSPGHTIDTRVRRWFTIGGDAYVGKFARAWVNENLIEIEEEDWYLVTTSDELEVCQTLNGFQLTEPNNRVEGHRYVFDKETAEALAHVFDGEVKEHNLQE